MGKKYKVFKQVSILLGKLMCIKHKSDKVEILKKKSQKLEHIIKSGSDKDKKKPKAYKKLLPKHGKLKKNANKPNVESLVKQIVKMDMLKDEEPSNTFKEKSNLRRNATFIPNSFMEKLSGMNEEEKGISDSEESIEDHRSMHISGSSK